MNVTGQPVENNKENNIEIVNAKEVETDKDLNYNLANVKEENKIPYIRGEV
jgi:hypothetical protein